MDISNPAVLISSLLIGLIGLAMFMYGKRAEQPTCLGLGIVMCVFPYFVGSLLAMWGIAIACMVALYLAPRVGL